MASTAELEAEILADLEENPDAYTAPVNDIITIDPETKTINLPLSEVLFGTEEEHGVERKYFKCPRIVGDNIDLFTHQIYISYMAVRDKNATFIPDSIPQPYWCDDVALDETGNYITFSWLLSGNVLASRGFVGFAVIAKSVEGDILKTRWKTAPAVGTVLMTVPDAGEGIAELYPDIITQLLDRMDAVEEIATVEAMQGYVDDYLGRNPVQLDSTLTDPEKAAPANMVGELRDDFEMLSNLQDFVITSFAWEKGGVNTTTGENNNNGALYRSRSADYIESEKVNRVVNPTEFDLYIIYFDSSKTFERTYPIRAGLSYDVNHSGYIRFDFRSDLQNAKRISVLRKNNIKIAITNVDDKIGSLEHLNEPSNNIVSAVNEVRNFTKDTSDKVDSISESLDRMRIDIGKDIVIHVPNDSEEEIKNATIRLGLHKGSIKLSDRWNEIHSDSFDYNFESIRFYDGGKMLNHHLLSHGNYDFVEDMTLNGSGLILHTTDNNLIIRDGGKIYKSTDDAKTRTEIIEGTLVFVDSFDNIFYEKNYKLYKLNAPDYLSSTMVLDYSDSQSRVGYNAIAEDDDHNIFCGLYQESFLSKVFRMKYGESSFTLCFHDTECQHVHCITVNKRTVPNEIYVGLDYENPKPKCYRSKDSGDTFELVDIPFRGIDHGYRYFGDGFALGCGESNIKGGATIFRSTNIDDPNECEMVVKTQQGVRTIYSPKDGIIIAHGCTGWTNSIEQILMSKDNGLSWETVFTRDINVLGKKGGAAGDGIRFVTDYFKPNGSKYYQVIGTGYALENAYRMFFGGDFYCGICYVNVGDVPVGGKDITLKSGFLIPKSNESKTVSDIIEPCCKISPIGNNKVEVNGTICEVLNGYETVDTDGCCRYGGIHGALSRNDIGMRMNANSISQIGNIGLKRSDDMTVIFWLEKNSLDAGILLATTDNKFRVSVRPAMLEIICNSHAYYCSFPSCSYESPYYTMYAFTISESDGTVTIKTYAPDMEYVYKKDIDAQIYYRGALSSDTIDLSEKTWTLGNGINSILCGFSEMIIIDKALSAEEIQSIYHGRNYL